MYGSLRSSFLLNKVCVGFTQYDTKEICAEKLTNCQFYLALGLKLTTNVLNGSESIEKVK